MQGVNDGTELDMCPVGTGGVTACQADSAGWLALHLVFRSQVKSCPLSETSLAI